MKAFTIGCFLYAILVASSVCAQNEPLGDVARRSRAEREALHKANPSIKTRVWENDVSAGGASAAWDDDGSDSTGAKELVDRGLEMDRQGRFDDALAEYAKALKVRPNYARAYYDIGVVKGEQGRTAEAIAAYKQAIALDQTHWKVFNNLGHELLQERKFVEAEDVLEKAHRLFPDSLDIMMHLGNALADQHKFAEAIPYFRKILDVAPDWNNARQSLCYSLLQLGRRDEAAKVRAEWPSYRPNDPENCGGDCSLNK